MTVALLGSPKRTNIQLAFAWRQLGVDACVLWPAEAIERLGAGDTAIGRLDVRPTLDGVEPGIESLEELEGRLDIRLLNRPEALLACHDKLATAERLREAGLPHPWTLHIEPGKPLPAVPLPCVLKPRFGSWGQDVLLARTIEDLVGLIELISDPPWWNKDGALIQELVSDSRCDVRIVVAGDRVVGSQRMAGPGEWRTNVTLGGQILEAELPPGTSELAIETARAIGIDFVGVDLLPTRDVWTVLELNGAVDFDTKYKLPGIDPYAAILVGLGIAAPELAELRRSTAATTERRLEMTKTLNGEPARAGDEIVITGHAVGDAPRTAVILEVLGEAGTERFRVRWEDGHESIFFPGEDAIVRRPQRRRTKSAPA
jgi:RimK family alpha-L-glutamate ligase